VEEEHSYLNQAVLKKEERMFQRSAVNKFLNLNPPQNYAINRLAKADCVPVNGVNAMGALTSQVTSTGMLSVKESPLRKMNV
jgi:hypothetical protein